MLEWVGFDSRFVIGQKVSHNHGKMSQRIQVFCYESSVDMIHTQNNKPNR